MPRFVKRGDTVYSVEPAGGVRGILCRNSDGSSFLSVYHADKSFTDYDLYHEDLAVTIDADELASFYRAGDVALLDHDPGTLGIPEVNEDGSLKGQD